MARLVRHGTLAILAVTLAFLMGSFVARTADLWRHLAAGRLVAHRPVPVRRATRSATTATQNGVWVNPSWLSETLLYAALLGRHHRGGGGGGEGAGVRRRRSGCCSCCGSRGSPALAVGGGGGDGGGGGRGVHTPPPAGVRVHRCSRCLLAVVYRADWAKGNKWRMPAVVGGVTAAWANMDAFALLAPLFSRAGHPAGRVAAPAGVRKARTDLPAADDPFRAPPPKRRAGFGRCSCRRSACCSTPPSSPPCPERPVRGGGPTGAVRAGLGRRPTT